MARSRNIKPSIMDNEELAELPPLTRLLFIYMWMLADRDGRIEDRPSRIKKQALGYDDGNADEMLTELFKAGFIDRYEVDGVKVIQVLNFAKHQTPHIREAASELPAKCQEPVKASTSTNLGSALHDTSTNLGNDEASPRSPDSGFLIPDSLIPDTDIKEAIASLSSATDDLPGKVLELKKTELPCPHQKIIELYGKHLPNLAQPRSWDGQRQAALRQRWHLCAKKSAFSDGYADEDGGLAFWDSFFSYIARDTKLATGYESNGRTWVPDLPWILNSTNFQKIVDGKYDIQKVAASR